MADYNSAYSGATIDQTIEDAITGNIGKGIVALTGVNLDGYRESGFYNTDSTVTNTPQAGDFFVISTANSELSRVQQLAFGQSATPSAYVRNRFGSTWTSWREFWDTGNTTVDGSGFIKEASPIIKLFADKIVKNEQVSSSVSMQKNGVGDYLINGTTGFSIKGWYIEVPKDANGNIKVFVEYSESNGDISIKTYEPDYSSGKVKAGQPVDITAGRWIDIRLNSEVV